jgi:protein-L-isoaspartate(D-aspartate) O-methyltransferase
MSQSTACLNMIKQQLRTNNITDEKILNLYRHFPREKFMPKAYSDMQVTLEDNQVLLTPLEEAKIIQSAEFKGCENVLLIGSANVYLSVLLSQCVAELTVVDIHREGMLETKKILTKHQINSIELLLQDNFNLESLDGSFDAIIVTSAIESIPAEWLKKLKPAAKVFAAIGEKVQNAQWLYIEDQKVIGHEFIFSTHLPPLHQPKAKFIF